VLGIMLKLAVLELSIELWRILCDAVELSRELCVVLSIEDVVLEIFVAVSEFSVVDPALELSVVDSFLTPDIEDEATSLPVSCCGQYYCGRRPSLACSFNPIGRYKCA